MLTFDLEEEKEDAPVTAHMHALAL